MLLCLVSQPYTKQKLLPEAAMPHSQGKKGLNSPKKYFKQKFSPHLEPSNLPFLSYSVGSLIEKKAEAKGSGKEKTNLTLQYTISEQMLKIL